MYLGQDNMNMILEMKQIITEGEATNKNIEDMQENIQNLEDQYNQLLPE